MSRQRPLNQGLYRPGPKQPLTRCEPLLSNPYQPDISLDSSLSGPRENLLLRTSIGDRGTPDCSLSGRKLSPNGLEKIYMANFAVTSAVPIYSRFQFSLRLVSSRCRCDCNIVLDADRSGTWTLPFTDRDVIRVTDYDISQSYRQSNSVELHC